MSRTCRRRGQRHDYDWVLCDYRSVIGALVPFLIDPRSREGRRAIANFTRTHVGRCAALRRVGTGASSIIVLNIAT